MTELIIFITVFFAIFTQSVSGFGLALVSMPVIAGLVGVRVATPLVVLVAFLAELFLILRYRRSINIGAVWRLTLASAIGIPLGVMALGVLDETVVLSILGILIILYALYALLNLSLPKLEGGIWGYVFGFISGMLGGAYNVAGPLVIIYGNCRGWEQKEFKGNLQGFFIVGTVVAIVSHAISQNLTTTVWRFFLISLPAIGLGLLAGIYLDKFINPVRFRKIVLVGLMVAGVQLII
jgi:uncharacterized membrane protein YfcA